MKKYIKSILVVAEKAIWNNGGRKFEKDSEVYYVINPDFK